MRVKQILAATVVFIAGIAFVSFRYLSHHSLDVLNPAGVIGQKEKHLMMITVLLGLVVVIPVFVLTFYISWTYREGNQKAKYSPDLDGDRRLEFIWWGLPTAIITVLAVITWNSSHQLDPYKSINSSKPPLTIQVVALQWKWLFIYPNNNVASVNYARIPVNTPVNFQITSDAPMNSFWVPRLGGQIYAMSGMATQLNLMASQTGSFDGSSANISGRGFAGMKFAVQATSRVNFDNWTNQISNSSKPLTLAEYSNLAQPSEDNTIAYYTQPATDLFHDVMMQYMAPNQQIGSANNLVDVEHHDH